MVVHAPRPVYTTVAEVLHELGDIGPDRLYTQFLDGTATEKDLERVNDEGGAIYELVNGILVAKAMGYKESLLAVRLIRFLGIYLDTEPLGAIAGGDGLVRLFPKLVRGPDVSFTTWERLEASNVETEAYPDLVPELAVEVLSPGNTKAEMEKKLGEYFRHGVQLVWVIDPRKKLVAVHTAVEEPVILTESDTLDGGAVLPGFRLPLKQLFTPPRPPKKKGKKGKK